MTDRPAAFIPLAFDRLPAEAMKARAADFHAEMDRRRTVRHFAPDLLVDTFPSLDRARIDEVLAGDLDAEKLLVDTRPGNAPSPRPVISSRPMIRVLMFSALAMVAGSCCKSSANACKNSSAASRTS